jgi:ferrochelatase
VVGRLWNDPSLHTAMLNHLFTECRHEPAVSKEARVLMLLFHGTLVEERNGKVPSFRTGHLESLLFARRLTSLIESDARNRWGRVVTAFLNHDVGGKWSSPSFEEACHQFVGATCRQLSLFAAGYFSDGNETVHRSSHPALSRPELEVEAIPCLNDSSSFIACLAGKVVAATRQILVFSGDSFETVV